MTRPRFAARVVSSVAMQVIIWGALLFIPAAIVESGEALRWWRGWVLVAAGMLASVVTMLTVFPGREDLLEERLKPPIQEGQPLADRVILLLFLVAFCGAMAFI